MQSGRSPDEREGANLDAARSGLWPEAPRVLRLKLKLEPTEREAKSNRAQNPYAKRMALRTTESVTIPGLPPKQSACDKAEDTGEGKQKKAELQVSIGECGTTKHEDG